MIDRPMHLAADVLDEQLVDVKHQKAGRIDGVIVSTRPGQPPRVIAIEVSPVTLVARVNRRLARWLGRLDARITGRRAPFRIAWDALRYRDRSFQFDGDVDATPINAVEHWLRTHVTGWPANE
ncbi:MAG TPA: hypothetical protein VFW04_18810 [Gemmatimonadaceae bacterium]|nr:hypothetical protein [Gemmatimonadaceae bacterium]